MGITMTTTDAWGNLSVLLFYPEGRTFSPPPQGAAVVSLPLVGPCALPEASTGCFSRGGQTMPPSLWAPVIIACASGRQLSPCLPLRCKPLSSAGTTCHPPAKTCHSTRHALRVRQLYRSYGRCIPSTVHFLLSRQKKQNRPLQGAERK